MARGGMLDVVLAEDDGPHAGAERATDAARAVPPRRGALRRWAPAAAVVVAGLVAATLADDGGAQERATHPAEVPGLLAPLDGPLRELWRAPGGDEATIAVGHDLVLTAVPAAVGTVLAATDLGSGGQRWTVPLPAVSDLRDLHCVTVDTTAPPGSSPAAQRSAPATHVACRVVLERASLAEGAQGFAASTLLVLDARTGDRSAERPLDSRFSSLATAGPDLLVVELRRDGHGTVVREDPVTGHVLWTFRTSRPLPDLAEGPPSPTAQVRHGVIAVDGPAAWALTPAGSPLGEWYPQGQAVAPGVRRAVDLTVLPDRRFTVTDSTTGVLGGAVGMVTTGAAPPPGPGDGFAVRGRMLVPVVDDGSAPDVLLTVPVGAGQVVALHARTGRELWRAETRAGGRAVLLDGRLVIQAGRGVRALDVRSGALLWVAGPEVVPSGPDLLADGDVVLVPVRTRDRGPTLVALGLGDGRERWTASAPGGVSELTVLGGRLLALTGRETVALG